MENNKSHMTAISRRSPSVPMRKLVSLDLLQGRVLDFGCGKGFDADHFDFEGYDPYYRPVELKSGVYDTLTCIYVFNVLFKDVEEELLYRIRCLLKQNGKAYIAVRRDIIKEGFTRRGTYQRNVELELPKLVENSKLCIYILS